MQKLKIKFNCKICITSVCIIFSYYLCNSPVLPTFYAPLLQHIVTYSLMILCYVTYAILNTLFKLALLYRNVSSVMHSWKINKCHLDVFINLGRKLTRNQSNYFTIPVGENITFHFPVTSGFDFRFSETEAQK